MNKLGLKYKIFNEYYNTIYWVICEKHYIQYKRTNEHIVDIGFPNISDYKSYDYNKYSKSIRVSVDIQSKLDMLKRAGKIKKLLNTDTDGKE